MEDGNNSNKCANKHTAVDGPNNIPRSGILNDVPVYTEDIELPVVTKSTEGIICPLTEEDWPGWIPDAISGDDYDTPNDMNKENGMNNSTTKVEKVTMKPLSLDEALARQAIIIRDIWPKVATPSAKDQVEFLNMYNRIKSTNAPNFAVARIPVSSDLVIQEWERRLKEFHDQALCKFLKYGWPVGYHVYEPPATVDSNHPSAQMNIQHVRDFIRKELEFDAIVGPFHAPPFVPWCRISPIMTRPKRDSPERRIILDLSFPKGKAVNDGIKTTDHYGTDITYSLPSIADLIEVIKANGRGSLMWKADLTRAYRQLRADPLAILCWEWRSMEKST